MILIYNTSTGVVYNATVAEGASAHWAKIAGHMDLQIVPFCQFLNYSNGMPHYSLWPMCEILSL